MYAETKLSEQAQKIYEMLNSCPPRYVEAEKIFKAYVPTSEELSKIADNLVYECMNNYFDATLSEIVEDNMHGTYIFANIKFLFSKGLNPNLLVDNESWNYMWGLLYIDYPYAAAKIVRYSLEHGADPNLVVPTEGDGLYEAVKMDLLYDGFQDRNVVMLWLVLLAYGGCHSDGSIDIKMLNGNDVSIFKRFEEFFYEIEFPKEYDGKLSDWTMHIYTADAYGNKIKVAEY